MIIQSDCNRRLAENRKVPNNENSENLPLHSAPDLVHFLRDTKDQTLSQSTGLRTRSNTHPDVFAVT